MRFLQIFILLAFYCLEAKEMMNIHLPQKTKTQLCYKLSDHECTQEEQLQYRNYFRLKNDRLMMFFNTYSKNALYPNGSLNIPVVVNLNGKWQVIDSFIKDDIEEILYDPHDGIWLHTISKRKNGYSSLYYSADELNWQKIKLPSVRTFQTMQLCFQPNQIILTFQRVENDNVKAWVTTYQDAILPEPTWRLMGKDELYQKVCIKTSAYNNGWRFKNKKNSQNILFQHKYKNRVISFSRKSSYLNTPIHKNRVIKRPATIITPIRPSKMPRIESGRYTIQLGTFNYKTSLPLIYQEFARLKNRIVTKEIHNGTKIQYKVFLESFNDIHEATIRLGEIRSEYAHSNIAKSAFVTKLP